MNAKNVADVVWLTKLVFLIGIWEMVMGPALLLRGDVSGKVQTALAFLGTLAWIGTIGILIRSGLL